MSNTGTPRRPFSISCRVSCRSSKSVTRSRSRRMVVRAGSGLRADITLPAGVSGEFSWKGIQRPLAPGANAFAMYSRGTKMIDSTTT